MRRIALACFLLAAAFSAHAASLNYAGKWRLDIAASKDLPPRYASSVKEWLLEITQNGSTMSVDVTIETKDGSSNVQHFTYELDGTPATIEMNVRTPDGMRKVPATASAKLLDNGEIDLVLENEMPMGDHIAKITIREHWALKDSVLTVHKNDAMPMQAFEYDLVFRRP
jgi:hypothetical protein